MSAIKALTARDQELLPLAWLCLQGEVKIDFKKLAKEGGFTNIGSASNAWTRIAKKLALPRGGNKSGQRSVSEATPTNASPKRKRALDETGQPAKKARSRSTIKKEVIEDVEVLESEDFKPASRAYTPEACEEGL